jgi:hypothetical protein
MSRLVLPVADGTLESYEPAFPMPAGPPARRIEARTAYAAVHVVADPTADLSPDDPPVLDLDATLAYRHHVWSCGLGVAEAMDTAQRGMGLDWGAARDLITRTATEARAVGGAMVSGATTDQLPASLAVDIDRVIAAYAEQIEAIDAAGSRVAIMPSRHLAAAAATPDDYLRVYGRLLEQVSEPVVIHWLGSMFDPCLATYWGSRVASRAAETVLALCQAHEGKIDGVKLSLLDARFEEGFRRRLPEGVRLYTGDDFHYVELIRGADGHHSDALLGVFDPIAPIASYALSLLDQGRSEQFTAILEPTVGFARHLFGAPTRYYKTGVVFIAWLNGHQDHFRMVGGAESARSIVHLAELLRLADRAGVLRDPDLALARARLLLRVCGIEQ